MWVVMLIDKAPPGNVIARRGFEGKSPARYVIL